VKIYIEYKFEEGSWGGGNQFLKNLRKEFENRKILSNFSDANFILFNSHQDFKKIIYLKNQDPRKLFIHRVDGPMRLYNKMSDHRDHIVYDLNSKIADGTVFQTKWSYESNLSLGMNPTKNYDIIQNACDPEIFFKKNTKNKTEKIRIISTSWSNNINKGFNTYKYLDNNLDFDKYEYVFAGNSPFEFNNIKKLGALHSKDLAEELRKSDIYITASKNDPCSNSLIEAISCGLTCYALDSGGHPEILNNNNYLFENEESILKILDKISEVPESSLLGDDISDITDQYISFFKKIRK